MDIVLYYRGPLHANGDAKEKHLIRERFHQQLKTLWGTPVLKNVYSEASDPNPPDLGANESNPLIPLHFSQNGLWVKFWRRLYPL